MTTRIWIQKHTVAGRLPELDAMYAEHISAISAPGTEVHIATLPPEIYSGGLPEKTVRFGAIEVLYAQYFSSAALRAETLGYDAYIVATSQDPGVEEARTLASIPVVGYGESVFRLSAMLKYSLGIVGFVSELAEPIAANISRLGLDSVLRGFGYLDAGPDLVTNALSGDPGPFLDAYRTEARRLIARGATAIMPGEGIPNEILVHHGVTDIDGVPVIDCDGLVVKVAEFLADVGRRRIAPVAMGGYYGCRPEAGILERMSAVLYSDLDAQWTPKDET